MRLLEIERVETIGPYDDPIGEATFKQTIDLLDICWIKQMFVDDSKKADIQSDVCDVMMKNWQCLRVHLSYSTMCKKWEEALDAS